MTAKPSAVSFLTGDGHDHRGRSFEDVLGFDDSLLERNHDYVQWLFPLPEASRFNLDAPVLTPEALAELRASATAKANLRRARDRMLAFYRSNDHWLTAVDHNHLRITRIIRCLALILGKGEARAFHDEIRALVAAAGDPVNAQSIRYWREAMGQPTD
jgi:Opioid growth factor receptor (OGFr) conserved region